MLTAILSFLAGVLATGIVANRKPEWFARVQKVAADVDAKVTDALDGK